MTNTPVLNKIYIIIIKIRNFEPSQTDIKIRKRLDNGFLNLNFTTVVTLNYGLFFCLFPKSFFVASVINHRYFQCVP